MQTFVILRCPDPSFWLYREINIYHGSTSSGPYTKINSALNATTSYTDSTFQAGLTYYYATTAVDGSGRESGYSNQVQAAIPTPLSRKYSTDEPGAQISEPQALSPTSPQAQKIKRLTGAFEVAFSFSVVSTSMSGSEADCPW